MSTDKRNPEASDGEEPDYPVYEPSDYSSQDYPLSGTVRVWDPGLHRTVDAGKSPVPEDSVILEVETMFVEREYRLIVRDFDSTLAPESLDAAFIALGGAYPGVRICYPIDEESYLEVKRPFTEEQLDMRVRDGACPDPAQSSNVIWVADPAAQPALMDTK